MRSFLNTYVVVVMLLCGVLVSAQTQTGYSKVNFSGIWIMDDSKTSVSIFGDKKLQPLNCDAEIVITQTDEAITMNSHYLCRKKDKSGVKIEETGSERKYFLDKRGETNTSADKETVYSETEIKKDILIIKEYDLNSKGKKTKLVYKREYNLSKDKKELKMKGESYFDYLNKTMFFKPISTERTYRLKQ